MARCFARLQAGRESVEVRGGVRRRAEAKDEGEERER
jgi:hypothetical protein